MYPARMLLLLTLIVAMTPRLSFSGPIGPAFQVADLAEGGFPSFFAPHFLAPLDGRYYFAGGTETGGNELWRTDGTSEGTELVADLCGGSCSSMGSTGYAAAVFDDALYFAACADVDCRLWRTDGGPPAPVAAGEMLEILPWAGSLYFTTRNELRRTDSGGADELVHHAGELPLADLVAGADALFFTAVDFASGNSQLWRTDGTPAGTFLVRESRFLALMPTVLGGEAVFLDEDQRLWVSDGLGAEPLLDDPPFSVPTAVEAIDGVLFVLAEGRELWRTDGTPEGTSLVAEPAAGGGFVSFRSAAYLGELFFVFDRPADPNRRSTLLYRTSELAVPEAFFEFPEAVTSLTVADDTLLVGTEALNPGFSPTGQPDHLWRSRGTPATTSRVFSVAPDHFRDVVSLDGTLLFRLSRDFDRDLGRFAEGDGSVVALSRPPGESSAPGNITRHRDTVLFTTRFVGWWQSDGTSGGTRRLPADVGLLPDVVTVGPEAFLETSEAVLAVEGGDLVRLFEIPPDEVLIPFVLEPTAEGLLFLTRSANSPHRVDLWIGDRESGAARRIFTDLHDFTPHRAGEVMTGRLADGDVLLFLHGALFRTDGTANGTRQLVELSASAELFLFDQAVRLGGDVFFTSHGRIPRLWRTDGTPEGTVLVREFPLDEARASASIFHLVAAGERLFFVVFLGPPSGELWTSDGTEAGTVRLRARGGRGLSRPGDLVSMDGRLVFAADDGVHGREIWTSDGSRKGTRLFLDLLAGPRSSFPGRMTVIDSRLVFAADDGVHGLEPWVSDGTPRGTRLLQDVHPGLAPSDPQGFEAAGGLVFFSAGTEESGFELWAVPRDALFEGLEASFRSPERAVQAKAVTFRDTSAGRPESWCWRFGDEPEGPRGCAATTPVTRHVFLEPGVYTVELEVERRLPSGLVESDLSSFDLPVGPLWRGL